MRHLLLGALALVAVPVFAAPDPATARPQTIQTGVRPLYLVDQMPPGPLKRQLAACKDNPAKASRFSIGHRGAALRFPGHTRESYIAAARQGVGIVECDVTFTKDRELVCRHAQCDLHTTTNVLAIPQLAAKCSLPFTPANPATGAPATAKCCASDFTLGEFRRLVGKMDGANPNATSVAEYMCGTPDWRTEAYGATGTLMTHRESIALFQRLGVGMAPEPKAPEVPMPYQGTFTQAMYAQKMIDEYKAAGVPARRVWPQSFNLDDEYHWIDHEPAFGRQAVSLVSVDTPAQVPAAQAQLPVMAARGVKIVAPPIWALLALDGKGQGDYYTALDVLANGVGAIGVFSDWPATTTYYANCTGR